MAGRLSLTGEEAILYTLVSWHFTQGALLDMALAEVAIEGEGPGSPELQPSLGPASGS